MEQRTKEQLIEELSYLPDDKLERLLFYANNIIIPEEDLLVDVTMKQLMEKAFSLADTYFPQWTDRSTSDFGRFLIEVFSIFSEKDFYYINAYANENLLSKMSIYSDAFMRVVELGYYPKVSRSSSAAFELNFDPSPDTYIIPRGSVIVQVEGNNFFFTNLEPIEVPGGVSDITISVQLNEGILFTETFQFNGYSVFLSKEQIDTETLVTTIEDSEWKRVRTFGRSIPSSKHFIAIPEDKGTLRVFFGDNEYGERPEIGKSVTINYLQCSNTKADNINGLVSINKSPQDRPVKSANILASTSGGSDPDTLSDLKNRGRNFFSSIFVLNNEDSVRKWLSSQYDVRKFYVSIINNNVNFKLVSSLTDTAEATVLNNIKTRMQPLITGGYFAIPSVTTFVDIVSISVQIFVLEGFDLSLTSGKVKQLIEDYTNPYTLAEYGENFNKTELTILLKSRVSGLQNIVYTDINGSLDDIQVDPSEIMRKIDPANITVTANEIS